VARRKAPTIEWWQGRAEALPFEANDFDAVVSQFGLMFFTARRIAIQEMMRVLRPGGRLAVAVWASVENFPGYAELADLIQRFYGDQVVEEFLAPFSLGAPELLAVLFAEAGVTRAKVTRQAGTVCFPSLRDWLWIEVKEWLLGDRLDETQFERLLKEAEEVLRPFVTAEGTVVLRTPAYIVTATKS
jgi:ubiquinone/menaquinone biosynthesis C-methylase UbiE